MAPFTQLREPVDHVQRLLSALGASLADVAAGYRSNDATVANGWERAVAPVRSHRES